MRLIEKAWFLDHPIKWLLLPLSPVFWALSALRRLLYKLGLLAQPKLSVPVVVVGNIGVGGNGKTPVVVFLVEQLKARGFKVGVISRGYGGDKLTEPLLIDDNTSAQQGGDEPVLIYQRTKVPVVVSPDRVANVERLIELGCNLVISDDGLQHYRLKRDVELVVIDGKRRFGNGWLLPAGPLREGLWRLNTVDRVIVNGGLADVNEMAMHLEAQQLVNIRSQQRVSVAEFISAHSHNVNALAGIGSPQRFFDTLTTLGFTLQNAVGFVDHHQFNECDITQFDSSVPLLMTEKDAVKCSDFTGDNGWYLTVDAHFSDRDNTNLLNLITTRCKNYGI
ncbi:tetraacyldisaccharide 4'-kinase [Thalassotalea ponticola]|uniref:tetraacyldisaccharide 4'-kinase n=1 Tax=Thalassotalea ponticola TaxID=1523392 RepID=UPI0025B4224D|nr:tetraacyldisaccharide 4'-kinase [Thalassotalea ponticola]MDN3652624.1 tetraacyldisaccharide 4'-kinase [Thalassotalea ponticola]